MSVISSKEKNILLIGLVVILYGVAAMCYKVQMPKWTREGKIHQTAEQKLKDERALIAARTDWQDQYTEVSQFMPVFPYERDIATHWQRVMRDTADANALTIKASQSIKELEVGDVYELPIECKAWEGSLDSLVHFLHELSTQEGAMMDVRQLFIKPTKIPGSLTGSFTLYCAYMRSN